MTSDLVSHSCSMLEMISIRLPLPVVASPFVGIQKVCQYSAMCHRCQGPGIGLFVVDVLDSQESLRQSKAAKPAQADAQDSEVKCRLA